MSYPKFKFTCGCIYDMDVIIKQKSQDGKSYHCPEHSTPLAFKVRVCADCGIVFDANRFGANEIRCQGCTKKHQVQRITKYQEKYFKNGRKGLGIYKNRQHERINVPSGLKPNPVITNPYRSPCTQGCQLLNENKNDTACVECEYRVAYAQKIASSGITPDMVKTNFAKPSHLVRSMKNPHLPDEAQCEPGKICNKCGIPKTLSGFEKSKNCIDGYAGQCKDCRREAARLNRERRKASAAGVMQYKKRNEDELRIDFVPPTPFVVPAAAVVKTVWYI